MSDFWRDRSVLVTGSTGFLGKWLTQRLFDLRADVVCLIRDEQHEDLQGSKLVTVWGVRGNVCDQPLLERILGEYQVRTVFHLAAQTQVCVGSRNPVSTFDTNIRGTWALLEACRRSPLVEQIIVSSSDKAYGDQSKLPYTEEMPLLAVNPYDVGKACADRLAQCYAKTWDLPVAITRCGNLFGGGDRNWARLVPGTIRRLLKGERPVIHGDGKALRDWLYVEDAVDAFLKVAEWLAPKYDLQRIWDAFNLSMESPQTIKDIVRLVTEAVGVDLPPVIDGNPIQGEIRCQALDCTKAREVLGWEAKTGFHDGLKKTVAWYRENL